MLDSRAWQAGLLITGASLVLACHAYDETLLESQQGRGWSTAEAGKRAARAAVDGGQQGRANDAAIAGGSDGATPRHTSEVEDVDATRDAAVSDSAVRTNDTPATESHDAAQVFEPAAPPEAGSGGAAGGGATAGAGGSSDAPSLIAGGSGGGGSGGGGGGGGEPVAAETVPCDDASGVRSAVNGHCYFPLAVMNSWFVSRDRCSELGAHLVTITSADEQTFVTTLVGAVPRWTGLSRFGAPAFSWINGESVTYENWEPGRPNLTTEAGVALRGDTFLWFDDSTSQRYAAICERE